MLWISSIADEARECRPTDRLNPCGARAGEVGLRSTQACFWAAPAATWPCCSSRASTAQSAAPQAGLNRSDLGRHYNRRISGGTFFPTCSTLLACSPKLRMTAKQQRDTDASSVVLPPHVVGRGRIADRTALEIFFAEDELFAAGGHLRLCGMMDQSSPPTRDRARFIAVDLYVLRGYDGFSFADMAEATSTTRANIHHHFGNKRQLMAELIEGFVADAQQRITEIWTAPDIGFAGRFAGQLEDLRRFYLRYNPAAGDRNVWSPLARLRLDLPVLGELGTSALERVDRVYDASLRQAVAAAIRARELAPRTPIEDVTRILRVTLMSCAPMTQDSGSFAELEELLAALHRMIVAGWGRNTA